MMRTPDGGYVPHNLQERIWADQGKGGILMGGILRGGILRGGILRGGILRGGILRGGILMGGILQVKVLLAQPRELLTRLGLTRTSPSLQTNVTTHPAKRVKWLCIH